MTAVLTILWQILVAICLIILILGAIGFFVGCAYGIIRAILKKRKEK